MPSGMRRSTEGVRVGEGGGWGTYSDGGIGCNRGDRGLDALVKVFQGYQPSKTPLVPKPSFRKRRSFKRQSSHQGRGKTPAFLQAVVTGRDTTKEQAALHKYEETQEFANRSMEFAINKRQRAQFLTENADLVAYGAAMALRIAEAAQVTKSPNVSVSHFPN